MEKLAAEAAYNALHDEEAGFHDGTFTSWAPKRSVRHPYAATAGMAIGVAKRDVAPHDLFTTRRDASPIASVAEQAPGEQDKSGGGRDQ